MSAGNQSISVTVRIGSHKINVSMRSRNLREINSMDFDRIQQYFPADASNIKKLAHDSGGHSKP
jgi:hypothetical protein